MVEVKAKTKVLTLMTLFFCFSSMNALATKGMHKKGSQTQTEKSAPLPADDDEAPPIPSSTSSNPNYYGGGYNPYMSMSMGLGYSGSLLTTIFTLLQMLPPDRRPDPGKAFLFSIIASATGWFTNHLLENQETGDKFFKWFASFFIDQEARAISILHLEEVTEAPVIEDLIFNPETERNVHAAFDSIASKGKLTSILLYGPPGTGKTALASSAMHKRPMRLFKVASHHLTEAGTLEKLYNWSIELSKSYGKPVGIIIEEAETLLDALLQSSLGKGAKAELYSTFKTLLGTDNEHILWLLTTNKALQLKMLPEAVIRRFKHQILIGLPDCPTRSKIFRTYLRKGVENHKAKIKEQENIEKNYHLEEALENDNFDLCNPESYEGSKINFRELTENLSPDQIKITTDNIINFSFRIGDTVLLEYAVPFLENYGKNEKWLKDQFDREYADEKKYLTIQGELAALRQQAQEQIQEQDPKAAKNEENKTGTKKKKTKTDREDL